MLLKDLIGKTSNLLAELTKFAKIFLSIFPKVIVFKKTYVETNTYIKTNDIRIFLYCGYCHRVFVYVVEKIKNRYKTVRNLEMNLKKYGIAPVLFLHAIFPLIFSIGKVGMQYAPFSFFIALRALSCGLFSMGVYFLTAKNKKPIEPKDRIFLLMAGLFGIYLTFIPEFWALQYLSVGKVAFIFVLAPFFTALFSRLHGLEIFTYKKLIGLAIGFIGFLPVLMTKGAGEVGLKSLISFELPEVALIFAVACYAYSWVIIKRLTIQSDYSPWFVSGFTMIEGGLAALVTSFFYDGWYTGVSPVTEWGPLLWYVFLLMSVAITCFVLYIYLLKEYSATLVSFFGFTRSFFGAFYGWLFLGEVVPLVFYPSVLVVSFGLYLFYQEELTLTDS